MDLAALATPTDRAKLQYLQRSFAETLRALEELNFPEVSRRDARPILKAASEACIYDGEYAPVVRKYYAFRGDFSQVWCGSSALGTSVALCCSQEFQAGGTLDASARPA